MKNNKIKDYLIITILIRGLFLLLFNKLNIFELCINSFLALIMIIIYQKLNLKRYTFFKLILLPILLFISFYILNNITIFISDNILKNYSYLIILFSFLSISLIITFKGYILYEKLIELSSYLLITFSILTLILLIPYINFNNINNLNVFYNIKSISFSFFILIIYICINYINNYQINYKSFSFSIINILVIKIFITLILGNTLESIYKYSYISILKKIKLFDFIERMECFLSLQFIFDYLFLLTLFMLTFKKIIKDFSKKKKVR